MSAARITPETYRSAMTLLAAVLRTRWAGGDVRTAVAACSAAEFAAVVRYHGLAGVLGLHHVPQLKALAPEVLPAIKALQQAATANTLRALLGLKSLAVLFDAASLPWLSLKGVALSAWLYGDPNVRAGTDLDVLVDPEDFPRALEVLRDAGYQVADEALWFEPRQRAAIMRTRREASVRSPQGDLAVDLHFRTEEIDDLALPSLRRLLERESVARVSAGGVHVQVPAGDHALRYLATHAARSAWLRRKWGYDVLELLCRQGGEGAAFGGGDAPDRMVALTRAAYARWLGIHSPERKSIDRHAARGINVGNRIAASDIETQTMQFGVPRGLRAWLGWQVHLFSILSWRGRAAQAWLFLTHLNTSGLSRRALDLATRLPPLALVFRGWNRIFRRAGRGA